MTVYHVLKAEGQGYHERIDSSATLVAASDVSVRLHDDRQPYEKIPFGDARWHQAPSYGDYQKVDLEYERDSATPIHQLPKLHVHAAETEKPSMSAATDVEQGPKPAPKKPLFTVFTSRQKFLIVAVCAWGGFISPISNAIYLPALNILAEEFNVTITQMNLTVTTFLIFMGLTPMFIGSFADSAGYRPAFVICFLIYLSANVALALQDSYTALLLLRMLQSMGSSGTIALRNGVIASVITPAERGTALGFVQIGTLVGPAFGPVIGGALADTVGWRWIFWFLAIVTASALIPQVLFVPETNRKIVGNGALPPWELWNISLFDLERRKKLDKPTYDAKRKAMGLPPRAKLGWPNPMPSLVMLVEKDTIIVLICGALNFAGLYELMTSVPILYRDAYGFNTLQISLVYIAIGGGAATSAIFNGRLLDYNFRKTAREHNLPVDKKRGQDLRYFPIEKARMRAVFPLLMFGASSLLAYGWILDKKVSVAAAIVFAYCSSVGFTCCFGSMNSLLIDSHPGSPATVTAAANITRCLLAALASATIDLLITSMGAGWCFTFLSLLMFASSPLLWVIIRKGPEWREERYIKKEIKDAVAGRTVVGDHMEQPRRQQQQQPMRQHQQQYQQQEAQQQPRIWQQETQQMQQTPLGSQSLRPLELPRQLQLRDVEEKAFLVRGGGGEPLRTPYSSPDVSPNSSPPRRKIGRGMRPVTYI